jgi:diadenosine tetraphosphate (Ap4A) HIT family hydrolase
MKNLGISKEKSMNLSNTCKICEAHKKSMNILETYQFWILRKSDFENQLRGYYYLESKSHKESYLDLTQVEWNEYSTVLQHSMNKIYQLKPIKIYQISIAEAVPHLHIHLIPRYSEEKGIDYIKNALAGIF